MTKTRRIRKKITTACSFCLFAGLIVFIVTLASCGRNNNNNLKSQNKPIESNIRKADRSVTTQPQAQQQSYVPHEVLVKFNPDTDPETIAHIQAQLKLEKVRKFRSSNLFLMKITGGATVEAIIQKLKTYQAVKYAEPNYVVKANP